jgi:hypothetical protein
MLYLMWLDLDTKHSAAEKIAAACAAYHARFGTIPNVALVSEGDAGVMVEGVQITPLARVQRHTYQVGVE